MERFAVTKCLVESSPLKSSRFDFLPENEHVPIVLDRGGRHRILSEKNEELV